jgi:hypothetical protein
VKRPILLFALFAQTALGQLETPEPAESITHYRSSERLTDPVSRLQQRIASGECSLKFEPKRGYLAALLKELRIPIASQGLVFSKTSSQADQTSPRTPRAIYFSDDVYIGWVPGGAEIDIASVDPQRGAIFYTLGQASNSVPQFTRRFDCLECHQRARTLFVPGLFVMSVYTAPDGAALSRVADFVSGHGSPLSTRWGGWYVSGTHFDGRRAAQKGAEAAGVGELHLGNIFSNNSKSPEQIEPAAGANVTDLRPRFDSDRYLSSHSDIVALLVLEHQVRLHNLLTSANYETRFALAELAGGSNDTTRFQDISVASPWPQQRIALAGEKLLEYMLFRDEAPLKGRVRGTSGFSAQFERLGPRASRRRSLRQFDLTNRLFRYPCSFMVYSAAFDGLPDEMKNYLWRRLDEILQGNDRSERYQTMAAVERPAVLEILLETKPEFAAWARRHDPTGIPRR